MQNPLLKPDRPALQIALIYALIAGTWILFSDRLLLQVIDPQRLTDISIMKGLGFVLVTAILLYVLVRRDIRKIIEAEAYTRILLENVNDGVFISCIVDNKLNRFVEVNSAALNKLGYTNQEITAMTALDITKPELRPKLEEVIERLMHHGHARVESIHVTKDGREIPVEISSRMMRIGEDNMLITIARDISERLRADKDRLQLEKDKRKFYKETVLAVTGGKFELGEVEESVGWIKNREISFNVKEPADLANARHECRDYCLKQGMSQERTGEFILAVGEALANAVKHAKSGWMFAGREDDSVWVAVSDKGSGIDTFAIPKVAMLTGYTTKASMGLGYTMILDICDHVKLATGPEGTTIVMKKAIEGVSAVEEKMAVHAAIDRVI